MAWRDCSIFITEDLKTGAMNNLDLVFGQENGLKSVSFQFFLILILYISFTEWSQLWEKGTESSRVNEHSFCLNYCSLLMNLEICSVILKLEDLHV